jgi:hypothetical protein
MFSTDTVLCGGAFSVCAGWVEVVDAMDLEGQLYTVCQGMLNTNIE